MNKSHSSRLIAYIGSYRSGPSQQGGGIYGFEVADGGRRLLPVEHSPEPGEAGYLVYAADKQTLYCVDERKTDGRGPVNPPATVQAFRVDSKSGKLSHLTSTIAPGPRPTFLDYNPKKQLLVCANHGDFQHVEKIVRDASGQWGIRYEYDDSSAILFSLTADGSINAITDIAVFSGHGKDPNFSPQNGGHAQSSPHAHCAVFDPSGEFVIVCDKGTDEIHVFRASDKLGHTFTLKLPDESGPRHIAFDLKSGLAYATFEFSSELACFGFDKQSGELTLINRVSTRITDFNGCNEPAEVRVNPSNSVVYINNRGEDNLVWFTTNDRGDLNYRGAISLAPSPHPGLAARSFTFTNDGDLMFVADRPAHLVHCYRVCPVTGDLSWLSQTHVPEPATVALAMLP